MYPANPVGEADPAHPVYSYLDRTEDIYRMRRIGFAHRIRKIKEMSLF